MTNQELFYTYNMEVYRFCYYLLRNAADAEDMCQDVFLKALVCDRSGIPETALKAWLMRIAVNTCTNATKRSKLKLIKEAIYYGWRGTSGLNESAETVFEGHWERQELNELLNQLSDKLRKVIILKYLNDCTNQEIADILSIPLGTVKSRVHKGLKVLQGKLRGNPDSLAIAKGGANYGTEH
ncbi:hypothetical protein SY83_18990 [Paenibacillus swuensis]|uniref:RNA polymerase sigma-70 factor n=1 Tax=Paenibacillus swuensis TaxID=1178515 RepID=A0A172TMN6_9BACL|nr:RNA polymerase sigma factor [Paenibacillus swuensis]ANE48033.1 hypothetical protein SY83_18990 [Paenibacillus swuensis]